MKDTKFSITDVKEFLSTVGIDWSGKIYKFNIQSASTPTSQDFGKVQLFICKNNETEKYFDKEIMVSNFQLITYLDYPMVDNDLSLSWCKFLIKKYGKEYAKNLFNWSVEHMMEIKKENIDKIEKYTNEVRAESQERLDYFDELAEESLKHINKEDLFDSIDGYEMY